MTRSLSCQIASLRHCIAIAQSNGADETVIETANAGLASLEWLERNTELIREVRRLMLDHPAIIAVLREFPGARVEMKDEVKL